MNSLFQHNEKSKASRALSMFFKLINITFAIHFGFLEFKSAKIKVIYKVLALLQAILLGFYVIYTFFLINGVQAFLWNSFNVYRYVVYITCLLLRKNDNNFHNYLRDFKAIDASLGVDDATYNFEKKMIAFAITLFVYHSFMVLVYYYYYNALQSLLHLVVHVFMTVFIDFVCVTNMFFYYAALCRLKKLYAVLKVVNSDYRSYQLVYRSIVDVVDKYKPVFDVVFLTTLLFCVVQIMTLVSNLVQLILNKILSPFSLLIGLNEVAIIVALMLTFGTALSAGMLTAQADAIKMLLLDKEIEHRDEAESQELVRFIKYIDTRGCQYRVFKVVPLDADLLGMVLGFCATYLIVIIQFLRPN